MCIRDRAQPGRLGSVVKHVTEMRDAQPARNRGSLHPQRRVRRFDHVFLGDQMCIRDSVLVLRPADAIFHRQILHRLHVQRDSIDVREFRLQAPDHIRCADSTIAERFQIDENSSTVERRICAIHSDKRRKAFDGRVLQDDFGKRLLPLSHRGKRNRLRRFGDSLNDAGVLNGKESLRNDNVQDLSLIHI